MRLRILVVLLGAISLWRILTAVPEPEPEEPAAPKPVAAASPVRSEEGAKEGAKEGAQDWMQVRPSDLLEEARGVEVSLFEEPPEPPPPDPLVPCDLGDEEQNSYQRESECLRRGGEVQEEPAWAKTD